MIKTILLFALLALTFTQDVANTAVDAANNAVDVAQGTTVGEAVSDPLGTANAALGNNNQDDLPVLNSVTVGWGPQSVVVTPRSEDPDLNDWISNGELLDVERLVTNNADGEWTFNWSVEDGDDWALLNDNGELLIVNWEDNNLNVVANLGVNDQLDAEIGAAAEAIVDYVWNSEDDVINTADLAPQLDNLVDSIWNNGNLGGFLSNANPDQSVADAVSGAVNDAAGNTQAVVDAAAGAV